MTDAYYAFYGRIMLAAVSFILLISAGIYATTRRPDLVRQYCGAHAIALILGALTDVALIKYILRHAGGLPPAFMSAVLLAPTVFFVSFSIYICHRHTVLRAVDVLIPITPFVAWGFLVLFGWQGDIGDYDILGAWFVMAGCGGVDLAAAFGLAPFSKRPFTVKLAGYFLMIAAVYVILPIATR
ncbi:MAG: hypothetical protein PHS14_10580 [Elusimicrobia bacterium]|nr:hypothetical protein [Elusimicrobiota bacterium]